MTGSGFIGQAAVVWWGVGGCLFAARCDPDVPRRSTTWQRKVFSIAFVRDRGPGVSSSPLTKRLEECSVDVIAQGIGKVFTDPDADNAREFFRHKHRKLESKLMSVGDAVEKLVHDGDYLCVGGFGANRIPTSACHEILRQGRKNMGFAGHTSTHDFQILCAGEVFRSTGYRLYHRPGGPGDCHRTPDVISKAARWRSPNGPITACRFASKRLLRGFPFTLPEI